MPENDTPTTEIEPVTNWSLLASEEFRTDFHGEVKEPDPAPVVETPETEVTEETLETEETEETADPENQVEEVPISSIEQLIEANAFDPEWFNSLKVPVKVNGEVSEATLADLTKSYQIQQAAEERLAEAKAKSKEAHHALEQRQTEINSGLNVLATLITEAETRLQKDYSKVNWDKLREDDPAEWSARQKEFESQYNDVQRLKNNAIQQYQANTQKLTEEQQAQFKEAVAREGQMLLEKIPEWKDEKVATAEKSELGKYLLESGYTKEEIESAADHRQFYLARKAMLYDKSQDKTAVAKKKVTLIPKTLKPGTPKTPEQNKQVQKDKLRAKLKQSGSLDDAFALYSPR